MKWVSLSVLSRWPLHRLPHPRLRRCPRQHRMRLAPLNRARCKSKGATVTAEVIAGAAAGVVGITTAGAEAVATTTAGGTTFAGKEGHHSFDRTADIHEHSFWAPLQDRDWSISLRVLRACD